MVRKGLWDCLGASDSEGDDGHSLSKYEKWTVSQLKSFLLVRGVPNANQKKDILVQNCYAAQKLGLVPKPISDEHFKTVNEEKSSKLVLDGGMIHVPDPDTLKDGWEESPASLPDLTQASVESYMDKSILANTIFKIISLLLKFLQKFN